MNGRQGDTATRRHKERILACSPILPVTPSPLRPVAVSCFYHPPAPPPPPKPPPPPPPNPPPLPPKPPPPPAQPPLPPPIWDIRRRRKHWRGWVMNKMSATTSRTAKAAACNIPKGLPAGSSRGRCIAGIPVMVTPSCDAIVFAAASTAAYIPAP